MLGRTSAAEIRRELAARIIDGRLSPGTTLDESVIAAEFAVSRTPVREALRLLAASGLVDQRPHAKAMVAKPDEAALRGMFEVMGYLEALCAGLCAVEMTAAERESLDLLHTEMAAIVHQGEAARYAEANDVFHAMVYEGSHNPYLAEIAIATRQRVQPFRRAQFNTLGRLTRSHKEHAAVVEAILQGDRQGAEAAMLRHIAIVETAYRELVAG